jgi:hypothetical protein
MSHYAMRGRGLSFAQRRRFLWIIFLIGIALIAVIAASATTLVPLPFDELAAKATAIARVKCFRVATERTGNELWTVSEFVVVKPLKGFVGALVTIRMPGGHAEGLVSHVDSVPLFSPGEEAYLFLWNRQGEPYRVLGWTQGAFRVTRDAQSGVERVTQDSAGAAIFDPVTRIFRRDGIRQMKAAEFEEKLRRTLAAKDSEGE